ncbi:MAG: response regulator transcription factor [Thermomicrobia bacterium]|nr:response regulator transcription factor [Thermomicrobia bacterium]
MNNAAQSPEKIRVIVADDHSVVRQGLRMFLLVQPDMELVGEAQNGREAVALAATLAPDVVLMDLLMPEMDGIEATAAIKAACPATQVLVLTTYLDDRRVAEAIQAGAVGFLLKEVEADDLIKALSISETTVKGHVANILGKLELTDRTQAAVYAVRNGLAREVRSSS